MKLSHTISFILGVLISALLLDRCSTASDDTVTIKSDTVVVLDTHYIKTKPRVINHWRDTGSIVLDTIQVLQDWSSTYVYADSVIDGKASINIIDTVTRNQIVGRSIRYVLPITTITNEITRHTQASGLYAGLIATQVSVSATATWVRPKWSGSVGYGTSGVVLGASIKVPTAKVWRAKQK